MPRRTAFRPATLLLSLASLVAVALPGTLSEAQPSTGATDLQTAQAHLDAERPEQALEAIRRALKSNKKDAQAILLRSTAHFMLGRFEEGREDLDRAIELDPNLRQAWLNRAALEIAEQRLEAAEASLRRAEELDPEAPDNGLNLGAVLLLGNRLSDAAAEFERYLQRNQGSAEAHYLIATNYAMAGYGAPTVQMLREAIRRDETMRLRSRTDRNFRTLGGYSAFQKLLSTPPARPSRAHLREEVVEGAYSGGTGPVLGAILDALQLSGQRVESQVEVTESWAVVFGDLRIVLREAPESKTLIELSSPVDGMGVEEFKARTEEVLSRTKARIATSRLGAPDSP